MKVLILAFILTYISAISSFEIQKIEGVHGHCIDVLFDSKFNTYVYCQITESHYIDKVYKLDPENNVVFVKEFEDSSCDMMVNDKDDLYLICGNYSNYYTSEVYIIRANSSEMEKIATINDIYDRFFEDNTGNLMYDNILSGFYFLKYNTTEPVLVKNMEQFITSSFEPGITDKNGDTYVEGYIRNNKTGEVQERQFIVIPADSKEGIPEGFIVDGILDDPVENFVEYAEITQNDELFIVVFEGNGTSSVKKLSNGTITYIFSNEEQKTFSVFAEEKRIIIIVYDFGNNSSRITSLTSDGEIVEIGNSRNGSWSDDAKAVSIDDEGNAFFAWTSEVDKKSHLVFLNHTDTITVEVDTGDLRFNFRKYFDGNNNLWMWTDQGIYFIEKGSLNMQKVPDSGDLQEMWTNRNKKANEVYMRTESEFYLISN